MTFNGEQIINAMENCKDDCKNCLASLNGKSCKDFIKAFDEMARKRHLEFSKLLENTK